MGRVKPAVQEPQQRLYFRFLYVTENFISDIEVKAFKSDERIIS